jgi:hypothetical protein
MRICLERFVAPSEQPGVDFEHHRERKMTPVPETDTIQIRILSTEGCTNTPPTISRIEDIAKELGVPVHIEKIRITTQEEASRNKFFGSPTVQINGVDLDPEKSESAAYGLA